MAVRMSDAYDVVVIGTGPAGEGAAMMLSKNHRKVAVVERYTEVGGGCTHWGTIPSKALRHAVKILHDLRRNPLLREFRIASQLTYPQLLASATKVVESQVGSRRRFYERNGFVAARLGDGTGNEEGEPDVVYERALKR